MGSVDRRKFVKSLGATTSAPWIAGASGGGAELSPTPEGYLTDVEGLKVGHFTEARRPTGCTVVLAEKGAVAGVDVRGAAPGTRETDLLNPINTVQVLHAVLLTGGSAFGLDAASGVMQYLEEKKIGFDAGVARVPIVPAAVLFDLGLGDSGIRPDKAAGYAACRNASAAPVPEGNVGAGAGATIGKLLGRNRAMKGGIGTCCLVVGGIKVAALVAVNAAGDVVDPRTGQIVAGARTADGRSLADTVRSLQKLAPKAGEGDALNTTIGVVATSAAFDKAGMTRIAQMAHDGLGRAIHPAHTPVDGDTLFALSTGAIKNADLTLVGTLAAEAVARAIVRAALQAIGIPGYPAARDLHL